MGIILPIVAALVVWGGSAAPLLFKMHAGGLS